MTSAANAIETDDDAEDETSSGDDSAHVEIIQIGSNSDIPKNDPLDCQCGQVDQDDCSEPFIKYLQDFYNALSQTDLICRNLRNIVKLVVDNIGCVIEDELIEDRAECGVEKGDAEENDNVDVVGLAGGGECGVDVGRGRHDCT